MLTLSDRYDAIGAVDVRLPVAHLLAIIPHKLMRAVLSVVDARQAMMIDVAKLRILKVAVRAEHALERAVDYARTRRLIVVVVHVVAHLRHALRHRHDVVELERHALAALHLARAIASSRARREHEALGTRAHSSRRAHCICHQLASMIQIAIERIGQLARASRRRVAALASLVFVAWMQSVDCSRHRCRCRCGRLGCRI